MVSSAVFSDPDVAYLAVVAPPSMPRMTLAETICRMTAVPTESRSNLAPAVERTAQQLINIVSALCSPQSGWPSDLPQTPENLAPYVSEEVAELLEALNSASLMSIAPVSAAPLRTQLLADWLPQLLWQIASSGYEAMRLMEGIQARLYWDGACASGIVRLVPVLMLRAGELELALDLVTQAVPRTDWLADGAEVQLAEGDLVGSLCTVEAWITEVTQQVALQHPLLADLLNEGFSVEALVPGEGWCSGSLFLCFHLVMEEDVGAGLALSVVEMGSGAIAPDPIFNSQFPNTLAEFANHLTEAPVEPERFTLDDFANTLGATSAAETVDAIADHFTLDDFASSIAGLPDAQSDTQLEQVLLEQIILDPVGVVDGSAVGPEPLNHLDGLQKAESLGLLGMADAGALVLQPRFSATVGDDLLSAWVTLLDEDWIQTFLQTLAEERFCQTLRHPLPLPSFLEKPEALVQAAYDAMEPVQGADGLFKHTFVHQPVLLADLWPRLRWYLTRTNQAVMQMMGGVPIQWLSPGEPWQSGSLYLKLFVVLQLSDQAWYLDLANGQVFSALPTPVLETTVIYPLTPELGQQPLGISEVTQQIDAQLAQVRSLTPWRSGVAIELHRLEAHAGDPTGRLHIHWQLTVEGEI
ncbi:MAG TPA: hypothetical protein V6D29_05405 [Leptolyngbyaceae cyanobacterium]